MAALAPIVDSMLVRGSAVAPKLISKLLTRRGLLSVSVVAALLYVCVCTYFWAVQIDMILKPRRDLPSDPGSKGLVFDEVEIPLSPDGNSAEGTLKAYWVPAESSDAPVLLYLHGQDATRGKNLHHTKSLHECGLHVLVPTIAVSLNHSIPNSRLRPRFMKMPWRL